MNKGNELPVRIYKNYKLPKESGQYHRILCMTGKNKGMSYFLSSKRIVLGRSDKADVQIYDNKSSREHAELTLIDSKYVLTDLGSQNGVVVNDLKVSQHRLKDNDKIIIGSTVYKYNYIIIEENELIAVEEEEEEEEEEVKSKRSLKNKNKKEKSRKKIIILITVALAVIFLVPDEGKKNIKKRIEVDNKKKTEEADIGTFRSSTIKDDTIIIKLEAIIHRGRREMREQNYFRAIEEFNLALILDPSNGEASFLLNKTKQRLDEHLKLIMEKASQEENSLRYRSAIKQYCQVVSYLQEYKDRDDNRYKQAKEKIEFLESKLGMEEGEVNCF